MLLAIDTATSTASLALYDFGTRQLLAELTWQARRRQTQDLMPALQDLMRLVDLTPAAITALAVTTGPGSFTGVRIAISAAKGMALGLPQPPQVVGIPTLSVTAAPYIELAGTAGATICAAIQAGRGRYNWAWFGGCDLLHRPVVEDHKAGTVADFAAALAARTAMVWLVGELSADLLDALAAAPGVGPVVRVDSTSSLRRAGQLARLAAQHLEAGTCDAIETLQPLYLRNP
ncbi:MAG: tRNA (adenosine(37)-N6)-threonylcarbamoyltransferase complex dimerization subunit type 1 TsaB [Caldilineaceae bacterium]